VLHGILSSSTPISCATQAYSYRGGDARQILTGISERGTESVIRYWVQENTRKKCAKSKLTVENIWAYLATHVRQRKLQSSESHTVTNCPCQKLVLTTAIICTLGILAAASWNRTALSRAIDPKQDWFSLVIKRTSSSLSGPVPPVEPRDWEWVRDEDNWVREDLPF